MDSIRLSLASLLLAACCVYGDDVACGSSRPRVLTGLQGSFVSQNYPSNYPNNANCAWRIDADTSDTTVRVEFADFDTESGYDEVRMYDGSSASASLIRRVSGGRPDATESTGSSMYITFTSDSSVNAKGFEAKYTTEKACSRFAPRGISATSAGSVESPYFPSNYGGGMRCNWTITAESDKFLSMSFSEFDVEDSEEDNCRWDYLEVYDGDSLQGRYCGGSEPTDFVSSTNEVKLFFRSDLAIEQGGFQINYTPVNGGGPGPTTPSGVSTTTGSGSTTTGSGSTTTGTPTTPEPTGTPAPTLPPPEGLFLEILMAEDITTVDGSDISGVCAATYSNLMSVSLFRAVTSLNNQIGSTLCAGVTDLSIQSGNSVVSSNGSSGKALVAAFMSSSFTRTFLAHHECSRELGAFLADHSNWQDDIIPSVPGCPDVTFTNDRFTTERYSWSC